MLTTLPARPAPLYRQIEATLRSRIATGELRPGDRLPSVSELQRLHGGVNHLTVRHALKCLADDGLVRAEQGRGVFVQQAARSARVALILPHLSDESYLPLIHGTRAVLLKAGFSLVILDSRDSHSEQNDHLEQLDEIPVDGAVIFPIGGDRLIEHVCRFHANRFPYVLVNSASTNPSATLGASDQSPMERLGEESARLLVQLLRAAPTRGRAIV